MVELIRILLGAVLEFIPETYREIVISVCVPVYVGIVLIFTFWLLGWFARSVYRAIVGGGYRL